MNPFIHANATPTRSSTPASQQSSSVLDAASNAQTSTQASTPPTIPDSNSISSPNKTLDAFKVPAIPTTTPSEDLPIKQEDGRRESRRRSNVQTYNLKVLSGTAVHSPFTKNGVRKATRDRLPEHEIIRVPRVRRSEGASIAATDNGTDSPLGVKSPRRPRTSNISPRKNAVPSRVSRTSSAPSSYRKTYRPSKYVEEQSSSDADDDDDDDDEDESDEEDASTTAQKNEPGRRKSTRLLGVKVEPLAKQVMDKKSKSIFKKGLKSARELRRLLDTKEYAHIDDNPVIHEVWSNGKLVVEGRPSKKRKIEADAPTPATDIKLLQEAPVSKGKGKEVTKKKYLEQGLYVGETANRDWYVGMTEESRRTAANMPVYRPTGLLPLPMWHGQRLLHLGRDFKLPYDVCSPLAPGQPKPEGWKALMSHRKNHLVGDAASLWKDKYQNDDSKCICSIDDGCGEGCHNREMMYECDSTNCNIGEEHCTNRSWAELEKRRDPKTSNIYTIGVEVFKTEDRGFGVRSNRCFNPNQIIVEYTGEIITEEECDRRMNEVYKNNDCYYLMSYEQNMILDATKGSIARFVNHSCNPNCNMVKWVVKGKPRIALFALDRAIMTGEELTYDYNFNPFAANNVQECRCGSANCRGIVGPRPNKGPQDKSKLEAVKNTIRAVKAVGSTTKRKLKELVGKDAEDSEIETRSPKKRRIAVPKVTRTKSAAPGFAASVQARLANASKAIFGSAAPPSGRAQRALNKDSSSGMLGGSAAPRAANETPSSPQPVARKRGRPRTVKKAIETAKIEKDGNHTFPNLGGALARKLLPGTLTPFVPAVKNPRNSLPSLTRASSSVSSSSRPSDSRLSHHPNVGEARLGRDEERDEPVNTIRRISADVEED